MRFARFRFPFSATWLFSALFALSTLPVPAKSAPRPNIIVIMADDLGYSDIGCYGGEIETPNLDKLAARGLRFTQFYNGSRCCPTRASLLTGLYPHQAGIGFMMQDLGTPAYRGEINKQSVTLAEALKGAGYKTLMTGKWHVSHIVFTGKEQLNYENNDPFWENKEGWPLQRGFDEYFGTIHGVGSFFDPFSLVRGNTPIRPEKKDFYYTDAINDQAVEYVKKYGGKKDPFFLYVSHTAPHWPLHALPEDIKKYEGKYADGWEALREKRHKRMIELGVIPANTPLSHRATTRPWKDAPDKEWDAHRMAVYAAMVDRMDQGIGRLMAQLEKMKIADNTMILFLSDNGACAENLEPGWYDVPSKTRDGTTVIPSNKHKDVLAGPDHVWQSVGPTWANASNTPFRWWKHYAHEGGIAAPLIVSWPKKMKDVGGLSSQVGHVMDFMPTFLDAAGARYPKEYRGEKILPATGTSLLPVLLGKKAQDRTLFWEHEGHRAARQGNWKLVAEHGKEWELYDLGKDRVELNNRAAGEPAKVKELAALYDAWAKKAGVLPWDEVSPYRNREK